MTLKKWENIKDEFTDALILGNGASIAVHDGFSYTSLWEIANDNGWISEKLKLLVETLKTGSNFELLLRKLLTAEIVDDEFEIDASKIKKASAELRTALINAVRNIHCSHEDVIPKLNIAIPFLKNFKTVFSLNYDLLVYWIIMASNDNSQGHPIKDCYNSGVFEENWEKYREKYNSEIARTLVFYPHGALQLFTSKTNDLDQKINSEHHSGDLLESVLHDWKNKPVIPLFVAEGDSVKKLQAIRGSTYLSIVYYDALPKSGPTLVIYGWSMDAKVDAHLLKQISNRNYKKLAVAVHRPTIPDIAKFITETKGNLKRLGINDVTYFDAESKGSWIHD